MYVLCAVVAIMCAIALERIRAHQSVSERMNAYECVHTHTNASEPPGTHCTSTSAHSTSTHVRAVRMRVRMRHDTLKDPLKISPKTKT